MFTGIIENTGIINKIQKNDDSVRLFVNSLLPLSEIKIGDSIAVNGVCLTVSDFTGHDFVFDVVKETLNVTNLKFLNKDSKVNLERAMLLSSRIDGHIVQGHIETVGEIIDIKIFENQTELYIKIDNKYLKYCVCKGSIAIDGISLTIAEINENIIKIAIIPHTLENTILSASKLGDIVNIETDMLSKYVEKMIDNQGT